MSKKLPPVSAKDLIKKLGRIGIVPVRTKGSHIKLQGFHKGEIRYTTVPYHSSKKLPLGILKAVLKDCEITRDEFLEL